MNQSPTNRITSSYLPGLVLFVLSVMLTLAIYKDYGISWDEKIQRGIGEKSYNYIVHHDESLKTFEDREYGVGFELILTVIEKKCHITDIRNVFLMRHLVTHLFFLFCVFCGYILIFRLFQKQAIACIGFLLLAFHPRIYAHSFFNTKDIPFLGIFLVALLISHIAFSRNKWNWYALLGIICGYAISIRLLGILLVFLFGLLFFTDIIVAVIEKKKVAATCINMFVFLICSAGTVYIAWPVLWAAPVQNFVECFKTLSHCPWDGTMLFGGKMISGKALPWTYLPVWFSITTPLLWLTIGSLGIILVILAFIKRPAAFLKNTNERNFLLYLFCFFLPVTIIIYLHSVVYDDWRHVYFIYPPFVMLCLFAINKIYEKRGKWPAAALCLLIMLEPAYFMIRNHPHQQVYFNYLVSHDEEALRKNYDLEYWGCAFKQGYEHIIAHDNADTIRVLNSMLPVKNNANILPEHDRKRILFVDDTIQPAYFFTNFRAHPDDYVFRNIVYEIKVENSTIMRIYKLP